MNGGGRNGGRSPTIRAAVRTKVGKQMHANTTVTYVVRCIPPGPDVVFLAGRWSGSNCRAVNERIGMQRGSNLSNRSILNPFLDTTWKSCWRAKVTSFWSSAAFFNCSTSKTYVPHISASPTDTTSSSVQCITLGLGAEVQVT
jgi:hypothetical protein